MGLAESKPDRSVNGLAVFGLGDQWVVLLDQRVRGPKREALAMARRFYFKGEDPAKGGLL